VANDGLASIGSLRDWISLTLDANPLSWICIGPLALGAIASAVATNPRKWLIANYLTLSASTLVVVFLAAVIALLLMLGHGWAILATALLLTAAIGIGSHSLVFVPHLNDGPRLGESAPSALLRIANARSRRILYQTIDVAASLPRLVFTRDAGIAVLVALTLGVIGFAYKNAPAESTPEIIAPTIALAVANPTIVPAVVAQTATPQLVGFRIAHTNNEGVLIREQPNRDAKPVASLMEGTTVEPVGDESIEDQGINWRRVREGGSTVGWVSEQYLEPVHSSGVARVTNTGGDGVFLRAKPGKAGGQIGLVHEGAELRVLSPDLQVDGKAWRNVSDGKGTSGWISAEFLKLSTQ
jgi:SH3-like domain-containing protein